MLAKCKEVDAKGIAFLKADAKHAELEQICSHFSLLDEKITNFERNVPFSLLELYSEALGAVRASKLVVASVHDAVRTLQTKLHDGNNAKRSLSVV